ncbi:KUP/HAK/KT family potassium transporter, partial [Mycobacterium tuberculosis]|nr:KUP/HAK/KT family potassium transporter [Mycobacterium tuberculosis]
MKEQITPQGATTGSAGDTVRENDPKPKEQASPAPIAPGQPAANYAAEPPPSETAHSRDGFWTLMVGSIGVVFGDIGTSPLYALRES